ncbi:MAG: hypothetical protein IPG80_03345 [Anaerolineales bacterium]|nr:hypothetical protein [Anaerolineales bacterium]
MPKVEARVKAVCAPSMTNTEGDNKIIKINLRTARNLFNKLGGREISKAFNGQQVIFGKSKNIWGGFN